MATAKGQELERHCRCVTAADDALDKLDRQLAASVEFAVTRETANGGRARKGSEGLVLSCSARNAGIFHVRGSGWRTGPLRIFRQQGVFLRHQACGAGSWGLGLFFVRAEVR